MARVCQAQHRMWRDDLSATHAGEMSFARLIQRNEGLICQLIRRRVSIYSGGVSIADLRQDVCVGIWHALGKWNQSAPLHVWVKLNIDYVLRRYLDKLPRVGAAERFWQTQVIEERLLHIPAANENGDVYEPVTPADGERMCAARMNAARILRELPVKQGRIIAQLMRGVPLEAAVRRVYEDTDLQGVRLAGRRAIAAARAVVEESTTPED